jgi:hypothetical protein
VSRELGPLSFALVGYSQPASRHTHSAFVRGPRGALDPRSALGLRAARDARATAV